MCIRDSLLGYVNPQDQSGASGLERMYDEELSLLDKKIFTIADVRGNFLQGSGLVVSSALDRDCLLYTSRCV